MKKFQVFGATSSAESRREKEHKVLARRASAEGIVLLKNDGVLPLQTRKIALYGPGSRMTVKGGSGSGDVHERHSVTIEEGLKNAEFEFPTTLWMDRFKGKYDADVAAWRGDLEEKIKKFNPIQTMQMFIFIGEHPMPYPACTLVLEDELTDTWAMRYEDYPGAETFGLRNGNLDDEDYSEGIYVGYRWFDKQNIKPRYPFGHGLSYTRFSEVVTEIADEHMTVTVTNTGDYAGKDVLQLYIRKPEGKLDHEKRSLTAFAKTKLLVPGESQTLTVPFSLEAVASFDEEQSAFVLERGAYQLELNDQICGNISVEERILETVKPIGSDQPTAVTEEFSPIVKALLRKLPDRDKCKLVTGGGYAISCYNNVMGAAGRTCTKLLKTGIPNIVLADGPAGLNVNQSTTVMPDGTPRYPEGLPADWKWGWLTKVEPFLKGRPGKGKTVYRYMTAWPSETVLAQTWDTELLEEVGRAVGKEMLEIGVSVWLAPGLNIHRNPLCGRNFEFYSEDPLVSGKMAAAITRGVQSMGGVGVAQKHYCCNNQEDNRTGVSANVSQRALREIYLRAFRIAVIEGKPWTVMSSYNRVNGKYVCNSFDFCTRVLRKEWGFKGLVMSDWDATEKCSYAEAINAGNDLIMPGTSAVAKKLIKDLNTDALRRDALELSAGRVLELIFKSDTCKEF